MVRSATTVTVKVTQ